MIRLIKRPLSPRTSRLLLATAITTVSGVLVTSAVVAAVSFQGQGTIKFDKVSTKNLAVSNEAAFSGSLKNPTAGKPVKVADGLKVTGISDLMGVIKNTASAKPVKVDDNLRVMGATDFIGALKNTTSGQPVKVEDDLRVTGALSAGTISGLSSMVSAAGFAEAADVSALSETVDTLVHNTNVLYNYLDCVSDYAQYTTYLESEDTIYCWNTWIAGVGKMASPEDATSATGTWADKSRK